MFDRRANSGVPVSHSTLLPPFLPHRAPTPLCRGSAALFGEEYSDMGAAFPAGAAGGADVLADGRLLGARFDPGTPVQEARELVERTLRSECSKAPGGAAAGFSPTAENTDDAAPPANASVACAPTIDGLDAVWAALPAELRPAMSGLARSDAAFARLRLTANPLMLRAVAALPEGWSPAGITGLDEAGVGGGAGCEGHACLRPPLCPHCASSFSSAFTDRLPTLLTPPLPGADHCWHWADTGAAAGGRPRVFRRLRPAGARAAPRCAAAASCRQLPLLAYTEVVLVVWQDGSAASLHVEDSAQQHARPLSQQQASPSCRPVPPNHPPPHTPQPTVTFVRAAPGAHLEIPTALFFLDGNATGAGGTPEGDVSAFDAPSGTLDAGASKDSSSQLQLMPLAIK